MQKSEFSMAVERYSVPHYLLCYYGRVSEAGLNNWLKNPAPSERIRRRFAAALAQAVEEEYSGLAPHGDDEDELLKLGREITGLTGKQLDFRSLSGTDYIRCY